MTRFGTRSGVKPGRRSSDKMSRWIHGPLTLLSEESCLCLCIYFDFDFIEMDLGFVGVCTPGAACLCVSLCVCVVCEK